MAWFCGDSANFDPQEVAIATQPMLGTKVRRLRRDRDLTQVDMARALGISPSYLNLIEHNQRPLTLSLLLKIGSTYDIDLDIFAEDESSRLIADLTETFGDALFQGAAPDQDEVAEMVASAPGAAQEVVTLYRAFRKTREDVRSLSERLSEDSFLTTSTHELRTFLTSIRSFSEILHDHADIGKAQRQEFLGLLVAETERLAETVNRMLDFATVTGDSGADEKASPAEQVRDLIQQHGNFFPELETAAESFQATLDGPAAARGPALAAELARRHGVTVQIAPAAAEFPTRHAFDPLSGRLRLSESLDPSARDFLIARQIALMSEDDLFAPYLDDDALSTPAARATARETLASYFAAAIMMPYDEILAAARELRYDIAILARRFAASFEQVCHRLTSLRRPGAQGIPLHFLRIDIAGNVLRQFSASGFHIPRFGSACPRWNVHAAFLAPGRIDRQVAEFPDGSRYFSVSCALPRPSPDLGRRESWTSVCIGCEIGYAGEMGYADGIDLDAGENVVPVGVTCRLCERAECGDRATPAIFGNSPPLAAATRP